MRVHRVRFSNTPTVAFLQARPQGVLSESHAQVEKVLRARRRRNASQKKQKRQCEDVQWEHEPECLGPKSNRVLGGGKGASEWMNRRCDERLLEAVRLEVVTPGIAASEEWGGCAMMIRAAAGHDLWSVLVCCRRAVGAIRKRCVIRPRVFVGETSRLRRIKILWPTFNSTRAYRCNLQHPWLQPSPHPRCPPDAQRQTRGALRGVFTP